MGKKHRATGRPRGRPPKIPPDLGVRILQSLRKRVDPVTGLVRPRWLSLAREFGVSRSTIARRMEELYASGAYERLLVKVSPKTSVTYYRLEKQTHGKTTSPMCGPAAMC